ncbi:MULTISPECIES: CDP-diacylglycerol--serine O-phosphatidyltransferase [Sporosarcina]|uniref:CDP-diacylglycerol--serine O-phosphatidyltransferase n=1 Tax=Sporosarcina contaminans TaxID=633403 RepID=A0ABW3U0A8_9BACL
MFLSRYFDYTKLKGQMANAITLLNLSFGIIAIILIAKELSHMSLVFIFLAALFDRFDGLVARRFHCESLFGKELDSLSDLVSFGVAPALLIYMTDLSSMLWVGIGATVFYILSGAVRLARYNVKEFDGSFYGLPITVAGVILALCYFLSPYMAAPYFVIIMVVLGIMMVSNFRIAKI